MGALDGRVTVLLAAAGAPWEAEAVSTLGRAGVVIGKRCVDVTDLLATLTTGAADLVVVAADLPGLDADAVRRVSASAAGLLAIAEPESVERIRRLGVAEILVSPGADLIAQRVRDLAAARSVGSIEPNGPNDSVRDDAAGDDVAGPGTGESGAPEAGMTGFGTIVTVWGPTGAPGRTTVATGIAAARSAAGRRVVLLDADPCGGAIGQNLGVLDEVSGLLAAARAVNEGTLTPESLAQCRRSLPSGLEVLTGLPRPDRWTEIRPGALAQIIETAALHADVVVDVGFGLVEDRHQGRDRITLEALDSADRIVAVGGAEPVSLVRLARGLVDLGERGTVPDLVVINRMRDSLGWTRKDLVGMVTGYVWDAEVRFVRDERETMDRALAAGRAVHEQGESRLGTDLAALVSVAFGS